MLKKTALIMAGGRGERFWPRSRKNLPKQFLSLTDDGRTMIQLTVDRILPIVDITDIYISTNKDYKELVRAQLPELPPENIICEPIGRNTAPCIGLGAAFITSKYEDALMIVLPSDHLCKQTDEFVRILEKACETAEAGENLVTVGIKPDYPETGYGYIKMDKSKQLGDTFAVERFVEKPDIELARKYLASGEYLWNSGMFIWKTSTILNDMKRFIPNTYEGLIRIRASIGRSVQARVIHNIFPDFKSESIDYAIMEKADDIYVIPGDFGWDDVGSWLAVERIKYNNADGNTISGKVVTYNTHDTIIEATDKKLIATVGLKDLIIVDTEDATLICSKEHSGDIKKILEKLREDNMDSYL